MVDIPLVPDINSQIRQDVGLASIRYYNYIELTDEIKWNLIDSQNISKPIERTKWIRKVEKNITFWVQQ